MLPKGCVETCPGCRYRALSPEESAAKKQAWTRACLSEVAPEPLRLRAPRERWGYRRRVLLHARRSETGAWELGLLRRTGPGRREAVLVSIPDCPLHAPGLNALLLDLRTLLPTEIPLAFVQASGRILTLILKCRPSETWRHWARATEGPLKAAGAESLHLNWNPAAGRRALSSRHQERIFGPAWVEEDGLKHGPMSFRQQIPELENEALAAAESFLAEARLPLAVDLYSGTGASLRRWGARGWRVAGVELVGEACEAAAENAPGALVLKGRVENRLPQLDAFLANEPFVLYTNPPRDGHDPATLAWIRERAPARIAYLSCNQKSLARDLAGLAGHYTVKSVQPFDFFPQTDHVESLTLLEKRD